jgi:integrase/recombinase XerD
VHGKGGKQRIAYLPKALHHELTEYIYAHNGSKYVFASDSYNAVENQPMTLVAAYQAFHEAAEKCGFKLRPHNLRHSFATHLQRQTRDITITQKALGHTRPETTMIYAQIADQDIKDAHAATFGD